MAEEMYLCSWIPITERLPDKEEDVLFYIEWGGRSGTVFREYKIMPYEEMPRAWKPLYWMPLPPPPKP